jgi:uncharacterized RDD family membrane protein YckC
VREPGTGSGGDEGADGHGDRAPLVRWEVPARAGTGPGAPVGTAARVVAYVLDSLVVGFLPMLPLLGAIGQASAGIYGGGLDLADPAVFDAWVRAVAGAAAPYVVGTTIGGVAISFVYFVGLWTTSGGATLGMRVVRFRLVDEGSGSPVTLGQAVRRWAALGVPASLLGLIPIAGMADVAALLPFWQLTLLASVALDAGRRGAHDRWAGTRMERAPEGARLRVALGLVLAIGIYLAISLLFAVAMGAPGAQPTEVR